MSIITGNMGLVIWDLGDEDFSRSDLANNWNKVDEHNHEGVIRGAEYSGTGGEQELLKGTWETNGKGLGLTKNSIRPGEIIRYLLAQGAVGHNQIGLEAVYGNNIKAGGIEHKHLGAGIVEENNVKEGSLGLGVLKGEVVPLGTVVAWYRPTAGAVPHENWVIMEGQEWKTVTGNKMGVGEAERVTGNVPNMLERFVKGTLTPSNTGKTGGNSEPNLAHTHTVAGHTHTVLLHAHTVNSHTHSISNDGVHNHSFETKKTPETYEEFRTATIKYHQVEGESELTVPAFKEVNTEPAYAIKMEKAGTHDHTGATGSAGGGETGETAPGTTSTALTTSSAL